MKSPSTVALSALLLLVLLLVNIGTKDGAVKAQEGAKECESELWRDPNGCRIKPCESGCQKTYPTRATYGKCMDDVCLCRYIC